MRPLSSILLPVMGLCLALHAVAKAADEKQPPSLNCILENTGPLGEAYALMPDFYLTDIFEAMLVDQTSIVSDALKRAKPSLKDVRVVKEDLVWPNLDENALAEQNKAVVGISACRPAVTNRLKSKGYGSHPPKGSLNLNITLAQPDDGSTSMIIAFDVKPNLSDREAADFLSGVAQALAKDLPEFSRKYVQTRYDVAVKPFKERWEIVRNRQGEFSARIAEYERKENLPREKLVERLAEMDRQLLDIRLSLVGLKAREEALYMELDKLKVESKAKSDADSVLQTLGEILKLRQEQFERFKKLADSGTGSRQELDAAETQSLEARMNFEQAQAARRGANRGRLDAIEGDLGQLAVEKAELNARLAYLEKTRDEFEKRLQERREAESDIEMLRSGFVQSSQAAVVKSAARVDQFEAGLQQIKPLKLLVPSDPFVKNQQ